MQSPVGEKSRVLILLFTEPASLLLYQVFMEIPDGTKCYYS